MTHSLIHEPKLTRAAELCGRNRNSEDSFWQLLFALARCPAPHPRRTEQLFSAGDPARDRIVLVAKLGFRDWGRHSGEMVLVIYRGNYESDKKFVRDIFIEGTTVYNFY